MPHRGRHPAPRQMGLQVLGQGHRAVLAAGAAEGKSYLTVSLGCTGGKHRSVALAEDLQAHLAQGGVTATVRHRDLGRE